MSSFENDKEGGGCLCIMILIPMVIGYLIIKSQENHDAEMKLREPVIDSSGERILSSEKKSL